MSYQDHFKTCSYCNSSANALLQKQKPTFRIKAASSYRRERKLSELASLITGASYPGVLFVGEKKAKIKAGSSIEKSQKLKELGRLIRG